eukprot:TRINITY_DN32885_c0_g2_i1.p1 TRINITY_DN32885_c0_g2~~TRINITY_DN32885_c0_g2_i1.p1  ORF type:complete len:543 (+),score=100.95 TRINITY_DN32885_c0_g2_i1:22-1629(+)
MCAPNMLSCLLCIALLARMSLADPDVGFLDWFSTEMQTAQGKELAVEGSIPSFMEGLFVQAGPGRFEIGGMHFGHALDGFCKVLKLDFREGKIRFTTDFLQSRFYQESLKHDKIAPGMTAAETTPPSRSKLGLMNALGPNDNNYIKPQKIGTTEIMTSDTMFVSVVAPEYSNVTHTIAPLIPGSDFFQEHWEDTLAGAFHVCIQATMAHGAVDPVSGSYSVATGCQTVDALDAPQYHKVFKIEPSNVRERKLLASVELKNNRRPSYMHQNAVTDGHYVIIATPLYMNFLEVMKGTGLAQGGLESVAGDDTLFQIVKTSDGSVREIAVPGFLMGHVVNAYEDGDDIVVDLTHYEQAAGGFFARYLLDVIRSPEKRDGFAKATVMRYRLHSNGSYEQSLTVPDEPSIDVELPVVNPAVTGKKYCTFWAVQFSTGNRSFASTAVVKRNLCTGEKLTEPFREGFYISEHAFVPRPGGTDEEDGVLLGLVFDGQRQESAVRLLDAKTLVQLATAPLGMKVPFPIHATWYGESSSTQTLQI